MPLKSRISSILVNSFFSDDSARTLNDANTADKDDFAEVVGAANAEKVVNYRMKNMRFYHSKDFQKIPGMPSKMKGLLKERFYVIPNFKESIYDKFQVCDYRSLKDFQALVADKPFFFLHANIRSLRKNLYKLVQMIHPLKYLPDVVCLAETKNPDPIMELGLVNYAYYSTNCTCPFQLIRGTGGTCVYVKKDRSFSHQLRRDLQFENANAESTWVELTPADGGTSVIVGSIYRHDQANKLKVFVTGLRESIQKIEKEQKTFYILGDMNVDFSDYKKSKDLLDLLEEEKCKLVICKPTHLKKTRRETVSSLVDHIYTNSKSVTRAGVVHTSVKILHHYPVYCLAE